MEKNLLPKHNSQLSRNHYNTIYDRDLQNKIRIARLHWRTSTLRDSTAICTDWIAQHTRIATHYCGTHRFDTPVPMHNVSQHMQNTIAQHQQKIEKVTWNHQFHCTRSSRQIRQQSDDAGNRRASEPTFLRNGRSVYPKNTMSRANPDIQIASMV